MLGIWGGRVPSKRYKYYATGFLVVMFAIFYFALTFNLLFTPRTIEQLIPEVIFYFNETAVMAKVLMIIFNRKKIIDLMDRLDSKEFLGDLDGSYQIVKEYNTKYKQLWKGYITLHSFAYIMHVFPPIPLHFFFGKDLDFPVCKYNFLSVETRKNYFWLIYTYQTVGIGVHMLYNVNLDTLITGVIYMAVAQIKALNFKLKKFKLDPADIGKTLEEQDKIQIDKFTKYLQHYELILQYCKCIQYIISSAMFVQFGMASAIICAVLSGLLSPSSSGTKVSMVTYLLAMCGQIFIPTYFGTQLTYESQEIGYSAYKTEWVPRSEVFKRRLKLFVERAKRPIVLTGLSLFPLKLETFTAIMKSAYSFFALIRNITDQ